jgi:hypothetical protein
LQVGDRVWVGGGYDSDPTWMAAAGDDLGYRGTVLEFIPGQNLQPAAVIKLDDKIILPEGAGAARRQELRGTFLVLELGHEGTDWATRRPRIHVELCDFRPDSRQWQERRKGVWGLVARNVRLLGPRTAVRRRTRAELLQVLMLPDFARIDMEDAGWS